MFDEYSAQGYRREEIHNSRMSKTYAPTFLKLKRKSRFFLSDMEPNGLFKAGDGHELPDFVEELEAVLQRKRIFPPGVRRSRFTH
jgi:hypothetical protein